MKITLEVDIEDNIAGAYRDFSTENKEEVNRYVSRILQKAANKARITKMRKTVEELQSDPRCNVNPEILYLLFQEEEY